MIYLDATGRLSYDLIYVPLTATADTATKDYSGTTGRKVSWHIFIPIFSSRRFNANWVFRVTE
jgi:hypothetical protein